MMKPTNEKYTITALMKALMIMFVTFAIFTSIASAASLEELRASGAIGESATGYVVARDSGAQSQAETINAQRREIYQQKATAQGVSADQVGKVYAQELFKTLPGGTWIQINGQWTKK